ncbi:CTD nuclear envelope phosphatase 1 homolog isoform X2 [Atheta coriaria]|uniref:CTD nuclear envelope phosphatase 1 homolog isoform X2 n=1 Tax=Dalotia coriaria TaxID=877792 RepID=UPI0031F3D101
MWKQVQMGLRAFLLLASRVWNCLCFMVKKQTRSIIQHQSVKYDIFPLSPLSRHRLSIVKRKTLVLDLDETLIHSFHDGVVRQTVRPGTPPDFILKVTIDRHPVRFFVHKRPHVDTFLDIVSRWYELVVFTASMEIYGKAVADRLDGGRGILHKRFYRQHCTPDMGSYTKNLSAICSDLSSVFILDNSPGAYRAYPDNAIPIKSWFSDPTDVALLNLLPVLDALRFTTDVRSVLSRNLHLHRLWSKERYRRHRPMLPPDDTCYNSPSPHRMLESYPL